MTVYLVGAGPGDPGLLTRRGADLLRRADIVVYDRLGTASLLDLAPVGAERVDVGKRPGERHHQERINELLVTRGRAGGTVVRLKGGDPFVFGRGGEEAEALQAAGIPFEVVPGVSSAFAVPAVAGVPVTHRGLAASVTVVTGHAVGDDAERGSGIDWEAFARAGGTLVVLMGVTSRAAIARRLIAGGRPADTPVLAVSWGTTPTAATVRTTLAGLGAAALDPPATLVIGPVAGLDLTTAGDGPLRGLAVVVTRAAHQADRLTAALTDAGATVVALPVIAVTEPADGGAALAAAAGRRYDWLVCTSANAVDRFLAAVPDVRTLAATRIAAVGAATAATLRRHRLPPDLIPDRATADDLVAAMPAAAAGGTVVYPAAAARRDVIGPGLRAKGWRERRGNADSYAGKGHPGRPGNEQSE